MVELAIVEEGLLLMLLLSSAMLTAAGVAIVGLPLPLPLPRERSNMRSFFSAPPVAMIRGRGWSGKATARTI